MYPSRFRYEAPRSLAEAISLLADGDGLGAVARFKRASELGRFVGGEPQQSWGRLANENRPVLRTHDRYGNRIDEVEFHPAWHQLMKLGVENELHSLPWTSEQPAAHAARAAIGSSRAAVISATAPPIDRPNAPVGSPTVSSRPSR